VIWTFLGFGVRSAVDFSPFVVEFALITCLKQHAPFRVNCTEVSPHKPDTCPHIQLLKSASPQAALLKQSLNTTQCEYPSCVAESGEGIEFSPQSQCHACLFRHSTNALLLSKSCSLHSFLPLLYLLSTSFLLSNIHLTSSQLAFRESDAPMLELSLSNCACQY
jgi:hypothetical protein